MNSFSCSFLGTFQLLSFDHSLDRVSWKFETGKKAPHACCQHKATTFLESRVVLTWISVTTSNRHGPGSFEIGPERNVAAFFLGSRIVLKYQQKQCTNCADESSTGMWRFCTRQCCLLRSVTLDSFGSHMTTDDRGSRFEAHHTMLATGKKKRTLLLKPYYR